MFGKLVLRLGSTLLLLAVAGTVGFAQDALTERQEVTAVDLVIELTKGGDVATPPEGLNHEELVVEEDGRALTVVGLDLPPSSEPWYFLVYFDRALSSSSSIRWAASALADRAVALTELGYVEIVVADPEPRRILAPTDDADLVDQTLSGVFLGRERESELLSLREEFLIERQEAVELSAPEAVEALVDEELRLVGDSQDALLDTLIKELPGTARRALVLISDGFDQHPEAFYRQHSGVDSPAESTLEERTRSWARTVAAYGWSVIVVNVEPPETAAGYWVVPTPDERTIAVRLPGLTSRLDGSMNPEKAAAHHELGQELAEQGEFEAAETALREALRFYHDHPKYALQRAAVLADMGEVLLGLDRPDAARRAMRAAVELDPAREETYPFMAARLKAPDTPLEDLADLSGGRVVRNGDELSQAIGALARRLRLTFQFQGVPDGETHRVAVRTRSERFDVRAPAWVRFGTPASVQALRARRLLAGEIETGQLKVSCRFLEKSETYTGRRGVLEIEMIEPLPEGLQSDGELRLTIGVAREEGPFETRSETISLEGGGHELPFEVSDDDVWLAVVVDDVASGRWGGATAEIVQRAANG